MTAGFMNRHLSPTSLYNLMVMKNINKGILFGDFSSQGVIAVISVYALGRIYHIRERITRPLIATLVGLEL